MPSERPELELVLDVIRRTKEWDYPGSKYDPMNPRRLILLLRYFEENCRIVLHNLDERRDQEKVMRRAFFLRAVESYVEYRIGRRKMLPVNHSQYGVGGGSLINFYINSVGCVLPRTREFYRNKKI